VEVAGAGRLVRNRSVCHALQYQILTAPVASARLHVFHFAQITGTRN